VALTLAEVNGKGEGVLCEKSGGIFMKTYIKCNRYYFEDWKMYSAMWLVYSTTVEAGTEDTIRTLAKYCGIPYEIYNDPIR
jgi:hypothetical protein